MTTLRKSAQKAIAATKVSQTESRSNNSPSTGTDVRTFTGHTGTIHCLHVHKGKLYTGSEDHTARKFDLEVMFSSRPQTGVTNAFPSVSCWFSISSQLL